MWKEFDFHLSENVLKLYPKSEYFDKLFHFKKRLLPILGKYHVEDFLMLDEGKFFLLRVEADDETARKMKESFDSLVQGNSDFEEVVQATWDPENNARTRILDARKSAKEGLRISFGGIPEGGWKIETWCEGHWVAKPDDLSLETEKFAKFMSKVVGKFTRAYLEEIPERVDDRWLLSVFVHLLLHSVSEQRFEKETRAFPWI